MASSKITLNTFLVLMKHRLSLMVAMSALAGSWMYGMQQPLTLLCVALGVFLLSGGASALNQWQEHRFDAMMERTCKRPIPAGLISASGALQTSVFLIVAGAAVLLLNGWIPMVLGLLNVVFYNLMYTKLKRVTTLAVFPGGLVGSLPPMIGWTSMGGNLFDPPIVFLASFIFLWQVPHFWLLIIKYGKQYEQAGFSSISSKYTESQIKSLVFGWVLISSVFLMFFPLFHIHMSMVVVSIFIVLNIVFIATFYRMLFKQSLKHGLRNAFILINSFLLIIMFFLVANAASGY